MLSGQVEILDWRFLMKVEYDHSQNIHTQEGPSAALLKIFAEVRPRNLLDVGCGTGTWLKAALAFGITDFFGVDGVDIPEDQLLFPPAHFRRLDFTEDWNLGRRFDAALCLEVAEHIEEAHAGTLIDALVRHADTIVFSAACPGQGGQHHVNCQWPAYWQEMFNQRGYACEDAIRWKIWDVEIIEPWYRQNMFIARRKSSSSLTESPIPAVVHPQMQEFFAASSKDSFAMHLNQIVHGRMSVGWYLVLPFRAVWAKFWRWMGRFR
jgi:SAM-dependent methyltransferase